MRAARHRDRKCARKAHGAARDLHVKGCALGSGLPANYKKAVTLLRFREDCRLGVSPGIGAGHDVDLVSPGGGGFIAGLHTGL